MIPTTIPLTLRLGVNRELTYTEGDKNFTALRDAILGLAETVGAGRVVIGLEPPLGERVGVLWIPVGVANRSGVYRWDEVNSRWVSVLSASLYAVTTGATNVYAVTLPLTLAAYTDLTGQIFVIKMNVGNSGSATLNVNGLGAVAMKKYRASGMADLSTGDLVQGGLYTGVYDGANFVVLNPTPATIPTTGPVFLASKMAVYAPGGAVAWTTHDASADVPEGAKAVILEADGNTESGGTGTVSIRKDSSNPTLILSGVGYADSNRMASQGIFPCTSSRTFQYQVTHDNGGGSIQYGIWLVGYIL